MQTFITDHGMLVNAKNLDVKRLGKQRVEAIQIANCLLLKESRWKNHPAVKMWKGYEPYLVHRYLVSIMNEWKRRGYKNTKCEEHYEIFKKLNLKKQCVKPTWITDDFITAHRSNLIRKDPTFYKPMWNNIPENLEYIWPY